MTLQTSRFFGRPVAAVPQEGPLARDKWAIVDALTRAAEDYGLSHRSITVLRTMLTFVPHKEIPATPGVSVVFASNDTLSARLGGMPESTLRRHLAALVEAGIIARIDSPNRKRYVRKVSNTVACAYGFDLAPLARLAKEIETFAEARQIRSDKRAVLHSKVLVARQRLLEHLIQTGVDIDSLHDASPLLARTKLILRRKDNNEELSDLLSDYETALATPVLNASDIENERHQHKEKNKKSEDTDPQMSAVKPLNTKIAAFKEYQKFFLKPAKSQAELEAHVAQLVPMLGIDFHVFSDAMKTMGVGQACVSILCILERFDEILNPGGYLRQLTKQARSGRFNLEKLIETCTNCQVTIQPVDSSCD